MKWIRERRSLSLVEKLILQLRGLRKGDIVLIRVQDYTGKHKVVTARVFTVQKRYYVFEALDDYSVYPYFSVKKHKIEKRILKIFSKKEDQD